MSTTEAAAQKAGRIKVETRSNVIGNAIFWEGDVSGIGRIRNLVARDLAQLVAQDGKPRRNGMWRVCLLPYH